MVIATNVGYCLLSPFSNLTVFKIILLNNSDIWKAGSGVETETGNRNYWNQKLKQK